MPWFPPSLTLKWRPYSRPDPAEQLQTVQTVQAALGGTAGTPLITTQLAVEKLRQSGVFDIDNVGAIIEELQKQAEEKKAEDAAQADQAHQRTIEQIQTKATAAPAFGKPPVKK